MNKKTVCIKNKRRKHYKKCYKQIKKQQILKIKKTVRNIKNKQRKLE